MRKLFILHFSFINALPILLPVIEDIYLNPLAKLKKTATKEKRCNEARAQRLKRYALKRLMSISVYLNPKEVHHKLILKKKLSPTSLSLNGLGRDIHQEVVSV